MTAKEVHQGRIDRGLTQLAKEGGYQLDQSIHMSTAHVVSLRQPSPKFL